MDRCSTTCRRFSVAGAVAVWALAAGCSPAPPHGERSAPGPDAAETKVMLPNPKLPVARAVPAAAGSELLITVVELPPPADEVADDDARTPRADRWVFSVAGETIDDVEALSARLREEADRHARPGSEGGLGHGRDTNANGERISRLAVRVEVPSGAPGVRLREVFAACNSALIYRINVATLPRASSTR